MYEKTDSLADWLTEAQGFNPGNLQNKWFALTGREMRLRDDLAPIAAQK
jgi:hypothetical protein